MFLDQIVKQKRLAVDCLKSRQPLPELRKRTADLPPTRDFLEAIKRDGPQMNLIAEIKKASPSRGIIRPDFNPEEIAPAYELAGAKAISVLTEEHYFLGDPAYLQQVKVVTSLPLLRKDFIIDDYQLFESRVLGADAVLLIAAILDANQLQEYLGLAEELGLSALVEIHNAQELIRVLATTARIVGINNRNLYNFQTELETTFSLAPAIPEGKTIVSESGIKTAAEISQLTALGVDAVLVGETLMRAENIGLAVRELMGGGIHGKSQDLRVVCVRTGNCCG